ncbi:MAG: thrombospondin type 3 repeat-containing protein [Candidatus Bipolaricaulota bacterium]|nr:thrombospondin type 3 repeat-containing protein [Candidatus Bipolaricaulota bacterium]MDW8110373.1 hypothetical protein [Candidatus Bipolaricaulota bacterium]
MRVLFTLALITALLALDAIAQDSDNDGLTDAQERILGTDPNKPDTDGDGLLDGEEYFVYFTTPTKADTDEDGLNDKQDPYPRWLRYEDLNGVAISTDRILQGPQGLRLHQVVEVRAGNVITTDWYNFLHPDFTMREARFTIKFDFLDPNRPDYQGEGYYKPVDANQMEILLPTYEGIFRATIPWPGRAMAYNDWIYHLYSKPLQVGQTYEYNVFFSEVIRWGEEPFARARSEVLSTERIPLETRLGRREYTAYRVRTVFKFAPFKDPFFRTFLAPDYELVLQAFFTVGETPQKQTLLRYTTPFFRITPTKSVGFSDFIVRH